MPHAYVRSFHAPLTPVSHDAFSFEGIMHGKTHSLAFVRMNERAFTLTLRQKNDLWLIKPDKLTRPAELETVKEALSHFCRLFCGDIVSANLAPKKRKNPSKWQLTPFAFSSQDATLFRHVSLEVGFGSGRHLLYLAKENPHKIYIGIEIYKPSIEQVLRQCELQNLANLYVVDFDARLVIESMRPESVEEIFVHFPVPWPDSPTRRVISPAFLESCAAVLKSDGFVELRTDDEDYYRYALALAKEADYETLESPQDTQTAITSKYEARWLRQGKTIYEARFSPRVKKEKIYMSNDFSFEAPLNIDILVSLPKKAIVYEGVLVHFEESFVDESSGDFAIKVSFGDTAGVERRYIVTKGARTYYYPFDPLCVGGSQKAHTMIKEYLYGKNS